MTEREWQAFSAFRTDFKTSCRQWLTRCGYEYSAPNEAVSSVEKSAGRGVLHLLQQAAAAENKTPVYPQETPIVYNHSLDELQVSDQIKLIIVSDNPGKNEQLHKNQRYLVGQAGKVAEGFFRRNPELNIDFRREAIILNKTPIHTAKRSLITYSKMAVNNSAAFLKKRTNGSLPIPLPCRKHSVVRFGWWGTAN